MNCSNFESGGIFHNNKFEIGDKVKIMTTHNPLMVQIGSTGTIFQKSGCVVGEVEVLISDGCTHILFWIHQDNLELVQKYYAPLTKILDELNITLL